MKQIVRKMLTKVLARLLEQNPLRTAADIAEYRENLELFVRNALLRLPQEKRSEGAQLS